jgi:hypothetical protein
VWVATNKVTIAEIIGQWADLECTCQTGRCEHHLIALQGTSSNLVPRCNVSGKAFYRTLLAILQRRGGLAALDGWIREAGLRTIGKPVLALLIDNLAGPRFALGSVTGRDRRIVARVHPAANSFEAIQALDAARAARSQDSADLTR